MSGDGLRDELTDAFRASDLAGGGIDYPTLVAAVLPVVQARIDAAREQVAAVEAVVAQAQHPALRCKTLAEDVELIWGGRTQARKACEQWKADRDAAVARAEAVEQAVQRVRELLVEDAWHYDDEIARALDGTP